MKRDATVTTKKETEFLMISKENYMEILNKSEHKLDAQSKRSFIEKHPLSKTLSGDLSTLAHLAEITVFPENQMIVKDGTRANRMYFIMQVFIQLMV